MSTIPGRRPFLSMLLLAALYLTSSPNAWATGHGLARSEETDPTVADVRVSHDSFKAHSEPALAENPRNADNLIAASKLFTDIHHYLFTIGTYYSLDGGMSWHDSGPLPGFAAYRRTSDVSIAFSSDGVAYVCVLAVRGKTSGVFVSRSTDQGRTFSAPARVFLDTAGRTFSDKPWITVDNSAGPSRGTVYVAWNLDPTSTSHSWHGIVVAHSSDGGHTFSAPIVVYHFAKHRFALGAIPAVGPRGRLYVAFLSSIDRKNARGKTTSLNQISLVTSHDGGRTFTTPRAIVQRVSMLPNHLKNGTFRNYSMPAFAVSSADGSAVVAWADMRHGDADILSSRSSDHGAVWSQPRRVNDDPAGDGKDQFQPALAVSPDGTYTCAWFDRRYDPHNRLIDEEVAQSTDAGQSFGVNVRVTARSWDPAIDTPWAEGKRSNTFIGDYQGLAADDTAVHPLWNDTQNGKTQEIRTAVVSVTLLQ